MGVIGVIITILFVVCCIFYKSLGRIALPILLSYPCFYNGFYFLFEYHDVISVNNKTFWWYFFKAAGLFLSLLGIWTIRVAYLNYKISRNKKEGIALTMQK